MSPEGDRTAAGQTLQRLRAAGQNDGGHPGERDADVLVRLCTAAAVQAADHVSVGRSHLCQGVRSSGRQTVEQSQQVEGGRCSGGRSCIRGGGAASRHYDDDQPELPGPDGDVLVRGAGQPAAPRRRRAASSAASAPRVCDFVDI